MKSLLSCLFFCLSVCFCVCFDLLILFLALLISFSSVIFFHFSYFLLITFTHTYTASPFLSHLFLTPLHIFFGLTLTCIPKPLLHIPVHYFPFIYTSTSLHHYPLLVYSLFLTPLHTSDLAKPILQHQYILSSLHLHSYIHSPPPLSLFLSLSHLNSLSPVHLLTCPRGHLCCRRVLQARPTSRTVPSKTWTQPRPPLSTLRPRSVEWR